MQTRQAVYLQCNIEACSCNYCCCWKAVSVTHFECVSVCWHWLSGMQSLCTILYCHLWPVWFYHIFPHCFINGTIFRNKLFNIKCAFWFSLQLLSETFIIQRKIQQDTATNLNRSSCKVPLFLPHFNGTWIFSTDCQKSPQILNFLKICLSCSMQTDRHDKANSYFSEFCKCI